MRNEIEKTDNCFENPEFGSYRTESTEFDIG